MNQNIPTDEISLWVENYTQDLYSWALHKVSDPELSSDLVQDTFLVAAEKKDSFKGDSSPKTWLFSILNHKIIDHYRKKVKQPVLLENEVFSRFFSDDGDWHESKRPGNWHEQENDQHLLDDNEFRSILKKCLEALPEKWSISIKLKYLSDTSSDEICQELDITPSNYWQIIHRAKLHLRDCIENNWFA